jgi:hypothetical protein
VRGLGFANRYLHNEKCLESCEGTGLAPYLPAKKGGECVEPFTCTNGKRDDGSQCSCPDAVAKHCESCRMLVGGPQCIKCKTDKTFKFLRNGACEKKCTKLYPLVGESDEHDSEKDGYQCESG